MVYTQSSELSYTVRPSVSLSFLIYLFSFLGDPVFKKVVVLVAERQKRLINDARESFINKSKIFRAGKAAGENDLVSSINKWQFFKKEAREG